MLSAPTALLKVSKKESKVATPGGVKHEGATEDPQVTPKACLIGQKRAFVSITANKRPRANKHLCVNHPQQLLWVATRWLMATHSSLRHVRAEQVKTFETALMEATLSESREICYDCWKAK